MRRFSSFAACLLLFVAALCAPRTAGAQSGTIYTDTLGSGWQNWSWCVTDFSSRDYVHGGSTSIKATYTDAWQGLYFHCDPIAGSQYTSISFWIHGGTTNGRNLEISGLINNTSQGNVALNQYISGGSVAANTWRQVTVPLSAIGLDKTTAMTGFWIGDAGGSAQPAFYVDDVQLIGKPTTTLPITIAVDANANRHAINSGVYGLSFAGYDALADLNVSLNRHGGNGATRYNWQQNASNSASDWYFESTLAGANTPGEYVDTFVTYTLAARAQAMVTIPTIGWVAKLGPNASKTYSFSVKKYGAQQGYDGWLPDAGNGVKSNGQQVTGNDANDANTVADSTFQQNWVKHILGQFNSSSKGGVSYYVMDNEPALWYTTHRDVHPTGATMDEVKSKIVDYAAKVKVVDSGAQIVGPEEWGWTGYFYSGYDMQYGSAHGWGYLPDRAGHNGADSMPWLLSALKSYDTTNKTKSLDVFSLHYYPQGGEYSDDVSTAMQLRRNRSTRSLWDPNYTDESWIGSQVQLIPRMKSWVSSNYAGLKTALTEYNWGAENHINGATAQADILGIFGREGLDMATRWTTPDPGTPTYKAIKMYTVGDGFGFGDTSISDTVPDPDSVSSFASVRSSDGALTIMLINKQLGDSANAKVNVANFTGSSTAQAYRLDADNTIKILSDVSVVGNVANVTLPPQTITLLVVPAITAQATNVTGLYNTGVDNTGNAATQGFADTHWSIPSTPGGKAATAYIPVQNWTTTKDGWLPDSSKSQWICLGTDAFKALGALGDYTYQTTFNVTGSAGNFKIIGRAAADNSVKAIILNGKTVVTNLVGYNTWGGFTLTSGFVTGTNTLQFIVNNGGTVANCTGFRCELSAIATSGGGNAPTVLGAPTNLTATGGNAQVGLTWNAVSGAATYNIKRSTTNGGPYTTLVSNLTTPAYTDTSVTNGTTYYYVATAVAGSNESSNSNQASATPQAPTAITALFNTGVDANGKAATQGTADIHWSIVKTPDGKSATAYIPVENWGKVDGAWLADTATSQWICLGTDAFKAVGAPGNYTYQTTFTVTGDVTKVQISGRAAADNSVTTIILNGKTVATNVAGYNTWGSFTLTSGFVTGTNTLQFIVNNSGTVANCTGFRAEMTGSAK